MYTITNNLSTLLALHGQRRLIAAGGTLEVSALDAYIAAAAQAGHCTVEADTPDATITAVDDEQVAFVLPWKWPVSGEVLVVLNGVALASDDYAISVDGLTLTLDDGSDVSEGDELTLLLYGDAIHGTAIQPGTVSVDKLDDAAQALIGQLSWGDQAVISGGLKRRLQLLDAGGDDNLNSAAILRVTASAGTIAIAPGGLGSVLLGTGTDDAIIQCSSTGKCDIAITYDGSDVVDVVVGLTQGSPLIDCSLAAEYDFGA